MIKKRFGTIAVDMGYITEAQLLQALELQIKDNLLEKEHRKIGQILIDLGFLTEKQRIEVLKRMDQSIMLALAAGR